MSKRRKKRKMRGVYHKRLTPEEEVAQREAAFAAIRRLFAEVLPLWRFCRRGYCRRHKQCCGEIRPCVKRCWPQMPPELQNAAHRQVMAGGPRRVPSAPTWSGPCAAIRPRTSLLEGRRARSSHGPEARV